MTDLIVTEHGKRFNELTVDTLVTVSRHRAFGKTAPTYGLAVGEELAGADDGAEIVVSIPREGYQPARPALRL
ncbi:hypothetical protein BIV25_42560 [Streptomyces sp. MUSC 14]|uniref:hypothetical protein n=1 Tax=Streptomyces sp. MUSC 14 TaxID=1354889 RepID=UPI0008F562EC|nr:hypothetical protein [Streptomyces sp. MUSC 14]OIJ85926.1 hypothetical protein BIV25_42560 [Streptomyces sp. MUSC 14]